MMSLVPAVSLAAALGMGAPATAQQPAPPLVQPVPDAGDRTPAPVPQPPAPAVKIDISPAPAPVVATPGDAVGRADDTVAAAPEQRGGGRRGGARAPGGPPRGPARPVVVPRGTAGPGWWGPAPVYIARPYYYDPFWMSGAFGWSPMFYAPWSLMWTTAGFGPYPWFGSTTFNTGGLRLKMKPRDAQVYVDGHYAGVVDEFDGIFQSLRLAPGGHTIEVRMPGFETVRLDVHIQPDRTLTIEEAMRPSNP